MQVLGSNITSKEKASGKSIRGRRILAAEVFHAQFLLLLQKINSNFSYDDMLLPFKASK